MTEKREGCLYVKPKQEQCQLILNMSATVAAFVKGPFEKCYRLYEKIKRRFIFYQVPLQRFENFAHTNVAQASS
jgi:hypothetical protein